MSQRQNFCFCGAMLLSTMSLCDVAQAQFPYAPPPAIDYLKPEQIKPDTYGPNGSDPAPRFRSSDPSSSSTSEFSPEQVREFASKLNNQLNASPRKESQLRYICSGSGDSIFRSKGFSASDIVIFKNELGC
jgi:hypothetical protein